MNARVQRMQLLETEVTELLCKASQWTVAAKKKINIDSKAVTGEVVVKIDTITIITWL